MTLNSLVPSSGGFSPEKIALIKRTIAEGASDDELALFIAQCQRTGLDPFSRQIYSIQRQVYDPKLNRKVSRMVTQVSIDGLRLIAERSGLYAGQVGPYFSGPLPAIRAEQEDPAEHSERVDLMRNQEGVGNYSVWSDIWSSTTYPFAAKVGVIRKDFAEPLYSVAYWSEYCPMYDGKPAQMWSRFPTLMLAKCAEASALRRAFPLELSGLFTSEEMTSPVLTSAEPSGWVHEGLPSPSSSPAVVFEDLPSEPDTTLDNVDPSPDPDPDERPYSPVRLRSLLAEVAVKLPPASPSVIDHVSTFLQNTLSDEDELSSVSFFLSGARDVRRASLRVVNAIYRWLKFDDLANPSPISIDELNAVRSYLSSLKI